MKVVSKVLWVVLRQCEISDVLNEICISEYSGKYVIEAIKQNSNISIKLYYMYLYLINVQIIKY